MRGSSVTITAIPNSKYLFENWSNGSTENPLTITINQNLSLTANFVKKISFDNKYSRRRDC